MARRLWLECLVEVGAVSLAAGSVQAAQIVFDPVAAPAEQVGASCPAPCFNVRMFFEDPTRNLEIHALQFDVAITGGGTAAHLPVPPASSAQAANGNFGAAPWSLSATVGRSPDAGFDALVVNAAAEPFSVDSVQTLFDAGCSGPNCSFIGAGLASNRIYLGRFNATLTGDPSFRISGITGLGAAISELRAFHTPDEVVPQPPPPASPPPLPSPPPISEPLLPPDPPPAGPILIGIPCGDGCLAVRPCESEGCSDLVNGNGAVFYTTARGPQLRELAAPEPATALLLLLGSSLILSQRALRRAEIRQKSR